MDAHLDHGVVGNGRVLALIAPDSTVEWLCLPRFDAPSVCGRLLDPQGGHLRVVVEGQQRASSAYLADTNVLRTTLVGRDGVVQIDDLCPRPEAGDAPAELLRHLRPLRGRPRIRVEVELAPDYGRGGRAPARTGDAARFGPAWVRSERLADVMEGRWFTLDAPLGLSISNGPAETPLEGIEAARDDAIQHWRGRAALLAPWLDPAARRSALCVALHRASASGAIIAAATTSVPEAIGSPRCWDYRFAWVRDGVFAAEALLQAGWSRPAVDLLDFFAAVVVPEAPQPLYGIGGETDLEERTLPHWRGFAGTGPVRVGNAAAEQIQHDTFGQLIWLAEQLSAATDWRPSAARWRWLSRLGHAALAAQHTPDAGIWEFRDRPGRYTFSRLWIWVALRGLGRIARHLGDPSHARWEAAAAATRAALLAAADDVGFFAQTLDGQAADASSLVVAGLGLVPGWDPRFVETIRRCERDLAIGPLMRRYVIEDDFGETTSTFNLCTLWWIEALAEAGQVERAAALRAQFLSHGNPVGLFAEDLEPGTGRALGNFPQVYSHLALIRTARALWG